MNVKILTILLASILFVLIIELIRRDKLTFKYALGWLLTSLVAITFAFFDNIVFALANLLGFELPSNFIFFSCLFCLVFLSLLLTIFLCQQNERNDRMIQKLALLENRIIKMEQK